MSARAVGRDDDRLVELIYNAAFDDGLWPRVLEELGDRAGAGPGNLVQLDVADGRGFGVAARTPDDTLSRFFDHWASRNPIGLVADPFDYRRDWSPRITRDAECVDRRVLERSPYWNEFLVPIGAAYTINLRLALRGNDVTAIGLGRPAHRGDFDDADIAALTPFHRHLIRAERMWRSLRLGEAAAGQVDALVAASPEALIFLDDRGRPLRWTAPADALLGRGGAVRVANGRLRAADTAADAALRAAMTSALAGGAPLPIMAPAPGGGGVTLSIARLGERVLGARGLLVVARSAAGGPATLRAAHGLTAAEAELAQALCDGDSLRAIAERRGVSIHTVRNQLGAVFDKTGCRRQQDLVRLLAAPR